MSKQTKALKLALEALEECRRDPRLKYEHPYYDKTITAIREALEQPAQQEPVAWGMPSAGGGFVVDCITPEEHDRVEGGYTIPLYTSPPAPKPLEIAVEAAEFGMWFDAMWAGDTSDGQVIPTRGHPNYDLYLNERTVAFGAWMAAKKAAHGIKGDA